MKSIRFALGSFLFIALYAATPAIQAPRTFVSGLGTDANPLNASGTDTIAGNGRSQSGCNGFAGQWDTDVAGKMAIAVSGNYATASYTFQGIASSVRGTVSGNILEGEWFQPNYSNPQYRQGRLRFQLSPGGGRFTGQWWDANGAYGGTWNGNCAGGRSASSGAGSDTCGYSLGSGIHNKWTSLGGKDGFLGCPVTNEGAAPQSPKKTTGRWAQFGGGDGGFIIWHGLGKYSGTSFEVHGCIFKLYASAGGTKSWLGFPISDEYDVTGGRRSDFEGGYVVWDARTSLCQAYKYESGPTGCSGFAGQWDTDVAGKMAIAVSGNYATASYTFQGIASSVRGTVSGNILEGEWFQPNHSNPQYRHGRLRFQLSPGGGRFTGQ